MAGGLPVHSLPAAVAATVAAAAAATPAATVATAAGATPAEPRLHRARAAVAGVPLSDRPGDNRPERLAQERDGLLHQPGSGRADEL